MNKKSSSIIQTLTFRHKLGGQNTIKYGVLMTAFGTLLRPVPKTTKEPHCLLKDSIREH